MSNPPVVDIEGRHLKLSNLDKVLYPAAGFTKGQVIDYYARVAPVLLPQSCGAGAHHEALSRWRGCRVFLREECSQASSRLGEDCAGLEPSTTAAPWISSLRMICPRWSGWPIWLRSSCIPRSPWARDVATPTMMVFDLDPGPPANIVQCSQVGLWLREIFEHFGLQSFAKTSGSKGLQIYVPLNTPVSYEQTKSFAHALARLLEQEHRELVVSEMKKEVRTNKVFIDWSQNDRAQDHDWRLFSPRARAAHGFDPGAMGRGRARAEKERRQLAGVRGSPSARSGGKNGRPVRAGAQAETETAKVGGSRRDWRGSGGAG